MNIFYVMFAALIITGMLIGSFITILIIRFDTIGSLRVDQSDPDDQPFLFLELKKDPSVLMKEKYVVMKVDTKNYIPRK